jgi:curli biogenesis system outer membrane secretion channel CsgG
MDKFKVLTLTVSILVFAMTGCATQPFPISDQMVKPIIDSNFPRISESIEIGAPVAVWWCDDERFEKAPDQLYYITTIAYWIQGYLEQKLVDEKKFKPVTRTKLEAVFKEQEFQMSGHVDDKTIVSIAKILGAKFMIVPTLTKISTLNLQVLNSETGEILYLSDNSIKQNQKIIK